jgi:beta-phosphoglucomutase-like phosphatase (HAD superfamily)
MGYVKSIAFDTDGVLVESDGLHFRAFNNVLKKNKLSQLDWKTYRDEHFIAYDDKGFFSHYIDRYGKTQKASLRRRLSTLVKEKQRMTKSLLEEDRGVKFFPYVLDTIQHLSRKKIPMFEVTGSTREEVARYFRHNPQMQHSFCVVISANDGLKHKPNPEPYVEGLKRLNGKLERKIKPEQVIVVEDALSGVRSAKSAGMFVVGISNTAEPRALYEGGADVVVDFLAADLFDTLLSLSKDELNDRSAMLARVAELPCVSNEINAGTHDHPFFVTRNHWDFRNPTEIRLTKFEASMLQRTN